MKVLRSKVEQVERDKRELQMRINQSSQGAMIAFQTQELQRQLDIARQNLAHKEQEVRSRPHAASKWWLSHQCPHYLAKHA